MLAMLFSTVIIGVLAQGENDVGGEGEFEVGESHCALGGIGLVLVMLTLGAGFLVSGRFGRFAGFKPLPIHKLVVVVMAIYLTGEFVYGLTVRNVLFISSLHGMLGFSVAALAWITASLNPLLLTKLVKWKNASRIHLIFAISLFIVLATHLTYAFSLFGE